MKLNSLKDLYIEDIRDLYDAEKQLVKALPKMAKAATSPQLKKAIETHLKETEGHVKNLENIFEKMDMRPRGKKCKGMQGLIEEAQELLEEEADPEVLDAGLIAAAQKAEHYEIAAYGTLRTYARTLGDNQAAQMLQRVLEEERKTDELLTKIAESSINVEAAAGSGNR